MMNHNALSRAVIINHNVRPKTVIMMNRTVIISPKYDFLKMPALKEVHSMKDSRLLSIVKFEFQGDNDIFEFLGDNVVFLHISQSKHGFSRSRDEAAGRGSRSRKPCLLRQMCKNCILVCFSSSKERREEGGRRKGHQRFTV